MNCASVTNRCGARGARGLTLLELVIALAILLLFIGAALLSVFHIIRTGEVAQAKLDAMSNARHALETMSLEIKQVRFGPLGATPQNLFEVSTNAFPNGNYKDDDGDGAVDEEWLDGLSQGGWTPADNRHARLDNPAGGGPPSPPRYERQRFLTTPDLGDGVVDVDARFNSATMRFRTFPNAFNPSPGNREVRFLRGTYDGEPNVLLRVVTEDAGGPNERTTTSPIAFGVLSFSALCWDPNTVDRGWRLFWNAAAYPATDVEIPPSVFLEVTCYAGVKPLSSLQPGEPIDTVRLQTVVDIESVLASPKYAAVREVYP
ncbi:MAG: prepilin-type N-terminal cleavage/methylation domain-containing protein [Candidatus Sumerlaeaceae bacterium]|nr:prepilin-type N-terminal cleavage/methylation domain-containing protein [Candidatus Sumerlaeaceae bacterium]